jgi:hypothetical protein
MMPASCEFSTVFGATTLTSINMDIGNLPGKRMNSRLLEHKPEITWQATNGSAAYMATREAVASNYLQR